MKATICDKTYIVRWQPLMGCYDGRPTQCTISVDGKVICDGVSMPRGSDKYDHRIGNKKSLDRALHAPRFQYVIETNSVNIIRNGHFTREQRRAFWAEYARMIHNKWA